jgi:hypothetical protein
VRAATFLQRLFIDWNRHHERDLFVVRQDGKIAEGRAWFEEN